MGGHPTRSRGTEPLQAVGAPGLTCGALKRSRPAERYESTPPALVPVPRAASARSLEPNDISCQCATDTNNDLEWALRPSVAFRKVANGFRSAWGADLFAGGRSVITSGRYYDLAGHTQHPVDSPSIIIVA